MTLLERTILGFLALTLILAVLASRGLPVLLFLKAIPLALVVLLSLFLFSKVFSRG